MQKKDREPADRPSGALTRWEAGDLPGAEEAARRALAAVPARDWARPEFRGLLTSILAAQGRNDEARREFEVTLKEELEQADGDLTNPAIRMARYFLGDHLVRIGDPGAALETVAPGLAQADSWILRLVEADAHDALGDVDAARRALTRALESAPPTRAAERFSCGSQISAARGRTLPMPAEHRGWMLPHLGDPLPRADGESNSRGHVDEWAQRAANQSSSALDRRPRHMFANIGGGNSHD